MANSYGRVFPFSSAGLSARRFELKRPALKYPATFETVQAAMPAFARLTDEFSCKAALVLNAEGEAVGLWVPEDVLREKCRESIRVPWEALEALQTGAYDRFLVEFNDESSTPA